MKTNSVSDDCCGNKFLFNIWSAVRFLWTRQLLLLWVKDENEDICPGEKSK